MSAPVRKLTHSPDDTMPFGKYKDTPIWQIMQTDPNYIDWLLADTDFELTNEGFDYWKKVEASYLRRSESRRVG